MTIKIKSIFWLCLYLFLLYFHSGYLNPTRVFAQSSGSVVCGQPCTDNGSCVVGNVCETSDGWYGYSYCMLSGNIASCKASGATYPLWEPCCKLGYPQPALTSPTPTPANISTPTPSVNQYQTTTSGSIAFYYGWPLSLGSVAPAANRFASYDAVVFGECLEKEANDAHVFTKDLITILRGQNKEVYGYIDFGVRHWTKTEIQTRITSWKNMGVTGIFWDDFSQSYENTPRVCPFEQNKCYLSCEGKYEPIWNIDILKSNLAYALSETHQQDLKAFINLWNWNEKLSNGNSIFTLLTSGDLVLAESLILSNGQLFSYEQFENRIGWSNTVLNNYPGIRKVCLSTFPENIPPDQTNDLYKLAVAGAIGFNCNLSGITDNYHSSGNSATLVNYVIPSDLQNLNFTGSIFGSQGIYRRSMPLGTLEINLNPQSLPGYRIIPQNTPSISCTSCQTKNKGDSNCDNKINALDFSLWKKVSLNPTANEEEKNTVDYNCQTTQSSHEINILDFIIWSQNSI